MKRPILGCLVICTLAALLFTGCCQPDPSESLAVTLHPQQTSMWCWAASGQMVMEYLGTNVSQCTQTNNEYTFTDCCNSTIPGHCVQGGWPEFDKYGFNFTRTSNTALTWAQLKAEVCNKSNCGKRPYCFTWHWNGGGGHMMVVIGYTTVEGVDMVEINDPWSPNVGDHRFITYAAYVSGAGYTHWDDFYQVRKK